MATTETEICNQALGLIGTDNNITSLTQHSEEARNARVYYNQTRLEAITSVPWGFTRREVSLNLLEAKTGTPENEDDNTLQDTSNSWNYTYAYPTNCVKPLFIIPTDSGIVGGQYVNSGDFREVQDTIVPYVEGVKSMVDGTFPRIINTDKASALLVYQADVSETQFFPPDFVSVLVHLLASKFCVSVKNDKQYALYLMKSANDLIQQAKVVHGLTFAKDRKPLVYNTEPQSLLARF
jgi:hypothetical protein